MNAYDAHRGIFRRNHPTRLGRLVRDSEFGFPRDQTPDRQMRCTGSSGRTRPYTWSAAWLYPDDPGEKTRWQPRLSSNAPRPEFRRSPALSHKGDRKAAEASLHPEGGMLFGGGRGLVRV